MALIRTSRVIDDFNKEASITFFTPAGVPVTIYSVTNGDITLTATTGVSVVSRDSVQSGTKAQREWLIEVVFRLGININAYTEYKHEIEKNSEEVKYKVLFGGSTIIDCTYDRTTKDYTFQPRSVFVLSLSAYNQFVLSIEDLLAKTIGA